MCKTDMGRRMNSEACWNEKFKSHTWVQKTQRNNYAPEKRKDKSIVEPSTTYSKTR
jgi:hypothetical protein